MTTHGHRASSRLLFFPARYSQPHAKRAPSAACSGAEVVGSTYFVAQTPPRTETLHQIQLLRYFQGFGDLNPRADMQVVETDHSRDSQ